jgi:hypothetical protein
MLLALFVLWTAFCSYLSGGIAGIIAEARLRGFRGVGLWNFATILALRARLASPVWVKGGLTNTKRWIFLLAFTGNYLAMNYTAGKILYIYLGHYTPG